MHSIHSGSDPDIEMAKLKEEMDDDETERLIADRGAPRGKGKGRGDSIPCEYHT